MPKREGQLGHFWSQVSEMSEMVSLRMGVKIASLLNMGEQLPHFFLHKIQYNYSKQRGM